MSVCESRGDELVRSDSGVQAFSGQSRATRGSQRAVQARRSLHWVDHRKFALMFALKFGCMGVKPIGATIFHHCGHR